VKVIVKDVTVYNNNRQYGPGQIVDLSEAEAEPLIKAGHVARAGETAKAYEPKSEPDPKPKAEKAEK
jgi:hypothetical protein